MILAKQPIRRTLTRATVPNDFVAELLTLAQIRHTGTFDCSDMNEDVSATVVGLNETKTFLSVEPLHCSLGHVSISKHGRPACAGPIRSILGRGRQRASQLKRGQVVRPKIDRG